MTSPFDGSRARAALALGASALVACVQVAGGEGSGSDERGNVLLILADDLGVQSLRVYEPEATDLPRTPVLDALAGSGVTFERVWSSPICSPTRAGIHTGQYAFRPQNGIGGGITPDSWLPLEALTLPEMLDAGTDGAYAHALIGKWHLGTAPGVELAEMPTASGWGTFIGTPYNLRPPSDYTTWVKVEDGETSLSENYALTDKVDDAIRWIGEQDQPWLLFLALNTPHTPYHAPPAELHSVDLTGVDEDCSRPEDVWRCFRAMVEAMDTEIGRLLDSLGEDRERTTVVFAGDNGNSKYVAREPNGRSRAKQTCYEGGVLVPMIVSGPDVAQPGTRSRALVNTTDVFATVADVAGVDLDAIMPPDVVVDSVSVLPYLRDPERSSLREFIFTERFKPNGATTGLPVPREDFVCQESIGFGSPGGPTLALCGPSIAQGVWTELRVDGAAPDAEVWVYASRARGDEARHGGTFVAGTDPKPRRFRTDANGALRKLVRSDGGPVTLYYQAVVTDPSVPEGLVLTNAVAAEVLPSNVKAIRGERYKLISSVNAGISQLFDLRDDPWERNNLLAGELSDEESEALARLETALARLLETD